MTDNKADILAYGGMFAGLFIIGLAASYNATWLADALAAVGAIAVAGLLIKEI